MAASPYGLSIVLDFVDNASAGMNQAAGAYSNLSGTIQNLSVGMGTTANSLLNMNTSVVGMSVLGSQLQNVGAGMLGSLAGVAKQAIDTGSSFENFGYTLKALYKDEARVNEVTNDLFEYAKKSPFQVGDLQNMVVTLKSQGLEAFEDVTRASDGFAQSTMSWIGDLQAFRPEATATQWKMAIQNFLSGDNTQSALRLRNILDVGDLSTFLGHDLGKTVQERMQDLTEIVGKIGMTGLQDTLSNTWSVVMANMEDTWSTFMYRIGFGNKDNNMYQSATNSAKNALQAMNDILLDDNVVQASTEAMYSMVRPIEAITAAAETLSPSFSKWLGQHPQLIKMATGMTAVGGAAVYAGGTLLKASAGALNWMVNVQRLGGISGITNMLVNSLNALSLRTVGIGAAAGLLYTAWKGNFFGIRDATKSVVSQVSGVLSQLHTDVVENGMTITESLNNQGLGNFTKGISALNGAFGELGKSFRSGVAGFFDFFGFNTEALTADTFNLKEALNELGDNLTQKFGNLDEFKEKWGGVLDTVGKVSGAFMTAFGATTVLGGGISLISGMLGMFGQNLAILGSTLLSPTGLLGMGLAATILGYQKDFLGLQGVMKPFVDNAKTQMAQLRESFGAKNSDGKNTIFSVIGDSLKRLNNDSKSWRFGYGSKLNEWVNGGDTSQAAEGAGVSIGQVLGQGIASGLIAFGNPIQKAIGMGIWAFTENIGGFRNGLSNAIPQLIRLKDLVLEMAKVDDGSNRALNLAHKFGLQDFYEGATQVNSVLKNLFSSFTNGFANGNTQIGSFFKDIFKDVDLSVNGIANLLGNLGKKFASFFGLQDGQIAEKFRSMASAIGEFASKALMLAPAFAGLKFGNLTGLTTVFNGIFSGSMNLITSGFSQIISAFTGGFAKLRGIISSAGQAIGNIFRNTLKNAFSRSSFGNTLGDAWNNLTNTFRSTLMSNFMPNLMSSFQSMGSTLPALLNSSTTALTNLGSALPTVQGGLGSIGGMLPGLQSGFVGLGFSLYNFGASAVKTIASIAFQIQAVKWQALFQGVTAGISTFLQAGLGATKIVLGLNGVAVALAGVSALALSFGTLASSDWRELSDTLKEQDTIVGKLGAGWDWFTGKLEGTTTKVMDFINKFDVSGFTEKLMGGLSKVTDSLASIIGGTNGDNGLANAGGLLLTKLTKGLADGSGGFLNSFQRIFDSVTTSIKTYSPAIGQNLGEIIGNAFQFAGDNAPQLFDTAFTIIDSFVQGLESHHDQIVTGATNLINGFIDAVKAHAPSIINTIGGIFKDIAGGVDGEGLGDALRSMVAPLVSQLTSIGETLKEKAITALGKIWDIVASQILIGLGKVAKAAAKGAAVIGGVFLAIGGLLNLIPGGQAFGGAFLAAGAGLESFAAVAGVSGIKLEKLGEGMAESSQSASSLGSSVGGLSSSLSGVGSGAAESADKIALLNNALDGIKEDTNVRINVDGSVDKLGQTLNDIQLARAWENNEIIYSVKVQEDGSLDYTAQKVERMKNDETGEWEYKLVVVEEEPKAEEIIENNKQTAESNPIEQKVITKRELEGQMDEDGNKTSNGNYIGSKEDVDKQKAREQRAASETAAIVAETARRNKEVLTGEYGIFANDVENRTASLTEQISTQIRQAMDFKGEDYWNGGGPFISMTQDLSEATTKIQNLRRAIKDTVSEKVEAGQIIPEDTINRLMEVEEHLKNFRIGASGNGFASDMEKLQGFAKEYESILEELTGKDYEVGLKINPETGYAEFVINELNKEDGTTKTTNFEVNTEGEEKVDETKNKLDEVDGTTATGNVNVETTGEEEVEGVKEAMEGAEKNVDGSVNIDTNGEKEVEDAKTAMDSVKDKDAKVTITPETSALDNVLQNTWTGTPKSVKVSYSPDTSQIDNVKFEDKTVKVNFSLNGNASVTEVASLKEAIDKLPSEKKVGVVEEGAKESTERVNALKDAIDKLADKTVKVAAEVSGKDAVDELAASIAAVKSKEVTVTVTTVEQKGGTAATGGIVTASEAFTLMNEQGGEIVDLPTGSRIYPHDESVAMSMAEGYNAGIRDTLKDYESTAADVSPIVINNNNNTTQDKSGGDVHNNDYSVHFGSGAIVVQSNGGDGDLTRAADRIYKLIEQKQRRMAMARR